MRVAGGLIPRLRRRSVGIFLRTGEKIRLSVLNCLRSDSSADGAEGNAGQEDWIPIKGETGSSLSQEKGFVWNHEGTLGEKSFSSSTRGDNLLDMSQEWT